MGGNDGQNDLSTVENYSPGTNSWSTVASMPTARQGLAAASGPDGRVYAIGGTGAALDAPALPTVEVYTPTANSWATKPPLPTPRYNLAAVASHDGRIYAIGGDTTPTSVSNVVEVYTPSTATWSRAPALPAARSACEAATGADGRIYLVGGGDSAGTVTGAGEVYTP
jgi:N-acetylneuraminic acid mutarotase